MRNGVRPGLPARPSFPDLRPWVHTILLWTPLLARFLLPAKMERDLAVVVAGVPVLPFDAAWFALPVFEWLTGVRSAVRRPAVAFHYLLFATLAATQILAAGVDVRQRLATLADASVPLVFLSLYNSAPRSSRAHALLLGVSAVILSAQVVVFSFGAAEWTSDVRTEEFRSSDLVRVRSTAGAATATGIVILLLAALGCDAAGGRPFVARLLAALSTVGVTATLSRATILALPVTFWRLIGPGLRHPRGFVRPLLAGLATAAALGATILLSRVGPAFSERLQLLVDTANFAAGRYDRYAQAWALFAESPLVGHGYGATQAPAWIDMVPDLRTAADVVSPHNEYLALLADVGLVGTVAYLLPLVFVLFRATAGGRRRFAWYAVLSMFVLCMNTETILLTFEFCSLLYLSLLSLLRESRPPHPVFSSSSDGWQQRPVAEGRQALARHHFRQ